MPAEAHHAQFGSRLSRRRTEQAEWILLGLRAMPIINNRCNSGVERFEPRYARYSNEMSCANFVLTIITAVKPTTLVSLFPSLLLDGLSWTSDTFVFRTSRACHRMMHAPVPE